MSVATVGYAVKHDAEKPMEKWSRYQYLWLHGDAKEESIDMIFAVCSKNLRKNQEAFCNGLLVSERYLKELSI